MGEYFENGSKTFQIGKEEEKIVMRESESFSNWPYFPRFWNTEVEMEKR